MPPTTDAAGPDRSAGRPLLRGLLDDASLFPPAALSVDDAVRAHRLHRAAPYAAAVGPFLVGVAHVADLLALLDTEPALPPADDLLRVVVVARPGADPATLGAAREALHQDDRVEVVGLELGWYDGWYDDLAGELPLAVEIPRGPEAVRAFAEVRSAHREGLDVVAKLRTGATPAWPWPDEDELASFLRLATLEVPFKLTGGLHHAGRGTYEVAGLPEENHGVLNVLVATSAALARAGQEEVAGLLALRDTDALAAVVEAWTAKTATTVREAFTAYGCCTVTDPLGELARLELLDTF